MQAHTDYCWNNLQDSNTDGPQKGTMLSRRQRIDRNFPLPNPSNCFKFLPHGSFTFAKIKVLLRTGKEERGTPSASFWGRKKKLNRRPESLKLQGNGPRTMGKERRSHMPEQGFLLRRGPGGNPDSKAQHTAPLQVDPKQAGNMESMSKTTWV